MNQNSFNPKARWDRFQPDKEGEGSERIEVTALFRQGKVSPKNFILNGREYPVERINYNWQERCGTAIIIRFSVDSAGMNYQISFNSHTFSWELDKILE